MKNINVNQIFTDLVADKIAQGYSLHIQSMSGSQGEIAHVDFEKGGQVYRLMAEKNHTNGKDPELTWHDTLVITFGRSPEKDGNDVWNNHLEVLEQQTYYAVGRRMGWHGEGCWGTRDEAIVARKITDASRESRSERAWANANGWAIKTEEGLKKLWAIIKKHQGYRTLPFKDIKAAALIRCQPPHRYCRTTDPYYVALEVTTARGTFLTCICN